MNRNDDPNGDRAANDPIAKLLRLAGPRAAVDPERTGRVHDAVRDAWRDDVSSRRRWRTGAVGFGALAGLATAAALILALWTRGPGLPAQPAAGAAIARALSIAGDVSVSTGPGATRPLGIGDSIPAGASLRTAGGGAASLALDGGGEVRVDAGTAITIVKQRELTLTSGAAYIDTGARHEPVAVRTPLGIVRDVGTRFEVRQVGSSWRTRVRDGAVRFEGAGGSHDAGAGGELMVQADGTVTVRATPPYGEDWSWTTLAAPAFRIEGKTLEAFLEWAAHEGGRPIAFADAEVARSMARTTLHGSIDGLSVDEALAVVLPTCGLTHETAGAGGGRIVVRRP